MFANAPNAYSIDIQQSPTSQMKPRRIRRYILTLAKKKEERLDPNLDSMGK